MPLLKNGTTPEDQTILKLLETVEGGLTQTVGKPAKSGQPDFLARRS
jgi:hypothetical protein